MPKKVKSFAMEEEPYEELFRIFKDSDAEVNISYCMNKYVKDLLRYLKPISQALKESSDYNVPMAFIIDTKAREPLFKFLDGEASPGADESSLAQELRELQEKYDEHIKKNPPIRRDMVDELGRHIPIGALVKYIAKMMVEDVINLGNTPDDRFREAAREIGGEELIQFVKLRLAPAFERSGFEETKPIGGTKSRKKKSEREE
ncbi:MAG: hypothetical protein ABSB94_18215 [Syntrophorhabdales bacterium]|jgi:hypothetical protein